MRSPWRRRCLNLCFGVWDRGRPCDAFDLHFALGQVPCTGLSHKQRRVLLVQAHAIFQLVTVESWALAASERSPLSSEPILAPDGLAVGRRRSHLCWRGKLVVFRHDVSPLERVGVQVAELFLRVRIWHHSRERPLLEIGHRLPSLRQLAAEMPSAAHRDIHPPIVHEMRLRLSHGLVPMVYLALVVHLRALFFRHRVSEDNGLDFALWNWLHLRREAAEAGGLHLEARVELRVQILVVRRRGRGVLTVPCSA